MVGFTERFSLMLFNKNNTIQYHQNILSSFTLIGCIGGVIMSYKSIKNEINNGNFNLKVCSFLAISNTYIYCLIGANLGYFTGLFFTGSYYLFPIPLFIFKCIYNKIYGIYKTKQYETE